MRSRWDLLRCLGTWVLVAFLELYPGLAGVWHISTTSMSVLHLRVIRKAAIVPRGCWLGNGLAKRTTRSERYRTALALFEACRRQKHSFLVGIEDMLLTHGISWGCLKRQGYITRHWFGARKSSCIASYASRQLLDCDLLVHGSMVRWLWGYEYEPEISVTSRLRLLEWKMKVEGFLEMWGFCAFPNYF